MAHRMQNLPAFFATVYMLSYQKILNEKYNITIPVEPIGCPFVFQLFQQEH
jgi:hypothetical protein